MSATGIQVTASSEEMESFVLTPIIQRQALDIPPATMRTNEDRLELHARFSDMAAQRAPVT
jgi:hypothetical protein